MTVLHVAAWRSEPQAIANLLERGAQLKALTPENQTALDISRRLARKTNLDRDEEEQERICITILEQAEKKHTIVVPKSAAAMLSLPSTEKELMSQLLYLENRGKLSAQKFLKLHVSSVAGRMREYNTRTGRDKSSKGMSWAYLLTWALPFIVCSGVGEVAVSSGSGYCDGYLPPRFIRCVHGGAYEPARIRNCK